VSRDAASALTQIARGLELLLADGDAALNSLDPEKAEALYGEVLKRAAGYTAYEKELKAYREGAQERVGIAKRLGLQLRIKAADSLPAAEALASYRKLRNAIAGAEPAYAPALAELQPLLASRISAARKAAVKAAVDEGDAAYAKADFDAALRAFRAAIAELGDRPEEIAGRAGLEALLAGRRSAAHAGILAARMASCDALYSAGRYGEAAAAAAEAIAYRKAIGAELEDAGAPFGPALASRLDGSLRASIALAVKRGDEALGRGEVDAALAAYAAAGRERDAGAAGLADAAAIGELIAGRQIAAARYLSSAARARADSLFIAGEFGKAEAEYRAALALLEASPRYPAAKASSRPTKDEAALLADVAQAAEGAQRVAQTVLEIFRNQVLSYRDRMLVLDVRLVRDPALKEELRRTALEAGLFILRNPSGGDATARARFAEALGMTMGDPALRSMSLGEGQLFLPFACAASLGAERLELPALSTIAIEGRGLAVSYNANRSLEGGIVLAAGFPASYRADGTIAAGLLATRVELAPKTAKASALVAVAGSPLLFHANGKPAYAVCEGKAGADRAAFAAFLDPAGGELLRCELNVERKLPADLELEIGGELRSFAKGTPLLAFGGGRYLSYSAEPGVRRALRLYEYAGPGLGDEVYVEGGLSWTGALLRGEARETEGPSHEVYLSPFWMQRREVTGEDYRAVMGADFKLTRDAPKEPLRKLGYSTAAAYANRLSERDGLVPCYKIAGSSISCDFSATGWRLPTEAEWEYAAMGGPLARGLADLGRDRTGRLKSSGAANELGLLGMANDIDEWCWDAYGRYSAAPAFDPRGASGSAMRVFRGKGLSDRRYSDDASKGRSFGIDSVGFRLVRSVSPLAPSALEAWAASAGRRPAWAAASPLASPWRSAAAAPFDRVGPGLVLRGAYGGDRELSLSVTEAEACGDWLILDATAQGTMPDASGRKLARGSYALRGVLNLATGALTLEQAKAIDLPSGYQKPGIYGRLDAATLRFSGDFLETDKLGGINLFFGAEAFGVVRFELPKALPQGKYLQSYVIRFEGAGQAFECSSEYAYIPAGSYKASVSASADNDRELRPWKGSASFDLAPGERKSVSIELREVK
jgi:hypothetical protein